MQANDDKNIALKRLQKQFSGLRADANLAALSDTQLIGCMKAFLTVQVNNPDNEALKQSHQQQLEHLEEFAATLS